VGTAIPEGVVSEMLAVGDGQIQLHRGGEGPPLLFLHPAGGGGWFPLHEHLSRRFEVWAPDHPGFSASDVLEDVEDVDDLVYHYLDLLDRFELESPAVFGHSFGGWVAAELAVHSPERVSQLVLSSPIGLRIPDHMPADLFFMTPPELVEALCLDPAVAPFPDEPSVDDVLQAYKDMSAFARYAWAPFLNNPKLERRLHRITAPTLVIWPQGDKAVPRVHAERYVERIPDARLETLEGCGHALLERPDAVAETIIAFAAARGEQR
jgi:pimeloyl-ACP methyl ester carboxylesterase